MVAANLVPRVINAISAKGPDPASTLTEAEHQDLLRDKLDLSGLEECRQSKQKRLVAS